MFCFFGKIVKPFVTLDSVFFVFQAFKNVCVLFLFCADNLLEMLIKPKVEKFRAL